MLIFWLTAPKSMKDVAARSQVFGHVWEHWVGGILLATSIQWAYVLMGALVFEAFEMEAEENGNDDFVRCLASFSRERCRTWLPLEQGVNATGLADADRALYTTLGPAPAPWRNFDMCGSAFFCVTLITTIGYGSFSVATTGGKLFACAYLLVGIPLNCVLFADLGKHLIRTFFGHAVVESYRRNRARLEKSVPSTLLLVEAGGGGGASFASVRAALAAGGVKASDERVTQIIATVDDGDGRISQAEFERLLDKLAERAAQNLETGLAVAAFLLSIVLWAIFLPLSDPDTFQGWDGLYFAVVTFSTVGLGDFVIDFSHERSVHGEFGYMMFLAISVEMALLAAVITTMLNSLAAMRAVVSSKVGGIKHLARKATGTHPSPDSKVELAAVAP